MTGKKAGHKGFHGTQRCDELISRTLGDVPDGVLTTFEKRCPPGYSKILPVIATDKDRTDMHW